jgi:hypothetical protein
MSMRVVGLTFALLTLCSSVGSAAVPVEVTIVNDPALPALSEQRVRTTLARAGEIVRGVCGRRIEFHIDKSRDLDGFVREHEERVAPYVAPEAYRWDPFETPPQTHRRDIFDASRTFAELDALRVLLPAAGAGGGGDVESFADALTRRFLSQLEKVKGLRDVRGEPLIPPKNWRHRSRTDWYTLLHSVEWTDRYRLYLLNGILLDDSRMNVSPATRARGGVTNGFVLPASRTAVIACDSILRADVASAVPRIADLSGTDRDSLLGYVVAQMLGPYLLMDVGPVPSNEGGLARPLYFLKDRADFQDLTRMKLPPQTGVSAAAYNSYRSKVLLRMDVLLVQQRWNDAAREGEKARADQRLSDDDMRHVDARMDAVRSHLDRK